MKIAIFGDSFGDDHINWKNQNRWLDVGPSWIDYLRQYHEVDNYCFGGSSLYYSKRKFDKTDLSKYDKVIFLTTSSIRRFQILPGDIAEYGSNWNPINVELRLKDNGRHQGIILKDHLTAIDLYFKYIHNESDTHFHNLMIESIKLKCPDAWLIDVASGSFIANIAAGEVSHFSNKQTVDILRRGFHDARKCHLSEENNLALGQYLHQCLTNNSYPTFKGYIINNPSRPFEHYFRKS